MKYNTFTGSLLLLHSLPPPLRVHITYSESEISFRQTLGQRCLASRSLPRSRFGSARSTTALLSIILRGLPSRLRCLCATSRESSIKEGTPLPTIDLLSQFPVMAISLLSYTYLSSFGPFREGN